MSRQGRHPRFRNKIQGNIMDYVVNQKPKIKSHFIYPVLPGTLECIRPGTPRWLIKPTSFSQARTANRFASAPTCCVRLASLIPPSQNAMLTYQVSHQASCTSMLGRASVGAARREWFASFPLLGSFLLLLSFLRKAASSRLTREFTHAHKGLCNLER